MVQAHAGGRLVYFHTSLFVDNDSTNGCASSPVGVSVWKNTRASSYIDDGGNGVFMGHVRRMLTHYPSGKGAWEHGAGNSLLANSFT